MKPRVIALLIIVLINLPFLLSNGNMFIGESWDFLDSNVVWIKLLAENDFLFAQNDYQINQFMNAPRISLGNEFDLLVYLVKIFGSYKAFVLNIFFQQLIAFIGLFLLNKYLFLKDKNQVFLNIIISFSFAMLTFWEAGGIGLAGLPYLLYIILITMDRAPKWFEYLFILIYPFYSSFFVSTIFILAFIILIVFYLKKYKNQNIKYPIIFIASICALSIFVNYRFFLDVLNPSFVSHRVEFYHYNNFLDSVKASIRLFILGQNHSPSSHYLVILPLVFICFIRMIYDKKIDKSITFLFLCISLISLLSGFVHFTPLAKLKSHIPIIKSLQIDRFYVLYPLFWYILFVLSIKYTFKNFHHKYSKSIIFIVVFTNLLFVFEKSIPFKGLFDAYINDRAEWVTFNEFYALKAYNKIKNKVPLESKVFSIGIHPSVSVYNNLNTIDGYSAYYRLDYKHKFRGIIQNELEMNPITKEYFDNWGSRCYIFDNELEKNFDYTKSNKKLSVIDLNLNYSLLKEFNCNFFISTVKVKSNPNIELFYQTEDKIRNYFLYKIKAQ